MYFDSVSYLVGSANAKLADDMKNINSNLQTTTTTTTAPNLDFSILKINCKKQSSQTKKIKEKLLDFIKYNRIFRIILFITIGLIVSVSMYKLIECSIQLNRIEIKNESIFKRNAESALKEDINDLWNGEKIPSIYELDPFTFYDSDQNGFGDIQGIKEKLDYIQKILKINCILIKNLQYSIKIIENSLILDQEQEFKSQLGSLIDFNLLLEECKKRSLKVASKKNLFKVDLFCI